MYYYVWIPIISNDRLVVRKLERQFASRTNDFDHTYRWYVDGFKKNLVGSVKRLEIRVEEIFLLATSAVWGRPYFHGVCDYF